MQLRASIKDEFIRRQALFSHCTGHIMRGAVNNVVSEEILALPESAVVRFYWVELVESVEERFLRDGEEGLQVCLSFGDGGYALVAIVVAFLVGALVEVLVCCFGWRFGSVDISTYVAIVIDDQRDFGEVALLPFVAGKVPDQIAVYGRTVVEVSECV